MRLTGFFQNPAKAKDAVEKLHRKGFGSAVTDMNDHYVDNRNVKTNLPGTETGPSLSAITINSGGNTTDRSKGTLLANSPMASGIGTFDEVADYKVTVKVEVTESNQAEAKKIIEECGGELRNPNTPTPKGLENIPASEMFKGLGIYRTDDGVR